MIFKKQVFIVTSCLFLLNSTLPLHYRNENQEEYVACNHNYVRLACDVEWTVVGAGPAGIVAIGILIDLGIPAKSIMWVDPLFKVGRLGEYYQNVPGNVKNSGFVSFLKACHTFQLVESQAKNELFLMDPNEYNNLSIIVKPLQDITDYLLHEVKSIKGNIKKLDFDNELWYITAMDNNIFTSRHVILATGSHPKSLDYDHIDIIPLDYALDKEALKHMVKEHDIIAVFGSSHSAILILKFLSELIVKQIINFYKHPIVYAVEGGAWTINNVNGLKGITAQWAKEILTQNPPHNLIRLVLNQENLDHYLPQCNKTIYAIGFVQNNLPETIINSEKIDELPFDKETGAIGPRLFGIGIAFDAQIDTPYGKEAAIGLNGFMKYAQAVIPTWLQKKEMRGRYDIQRKILAQYSGFINIWIY